MDVIAEVQTADSRSGNDGWSRQRFGQCRRANGYAIRILFEQVVCDFPGIN